MGADWGLYSAMRGQDNWQQRRADKAMELSIIEKQSQDEEKKVQKAMRAEEGINKYFDELRNMDVLAEDQERIQNVERAARAKIIKGIRDFNGDLTRYVSSGGQTDLHEYRNSVLESQEVKKAMTNKANLKNYLTDASKGDMFFHKVGVQVPKLDKDGNQMLKNGKPVYDTRMMDFDQQMALFKEGKIDQINYSGAEKKVKLNPFMFLKTPKDPRNPYSKDNLVTASNVKFQAMEMGASEQYATHLAKEYVRMTEMGGDAWRWGNKDPMEKELLQSQIDKVRASTGGGGGSSKTMITNSVIPAYQRLGTQGNPQKMDMSPKELEFWGNDLQLKYNSGTNSYKPTGALAGFDAHTGQKFDLTNALSVNMTGQVIGKPNENGATERFIVADVIYDADNPMPGNPHEESMGFANQLIDTKLKNNWMDLSEQQVGITGSEDGNVWKGQVHIPIESKISTPTYRTSMNKFLNLGTNIDAYAASATDADYYTQSFQEIMNIAEQQGVPVGQVIAEMNRMKTGQ